MNVWIESEIEGCRGSIATRTSDLGFVPLVVMTALVSAKLLDERLLGGSTRCTMEHNPRWSAEPDLPEWVITITPQGEQAREIHVWRIPYLCMPVLQGAEHAALCFMACKGHSGCPRRPVCSS